LLDNSGQKVDFPHASFSRRPQMPMGLNAISFDREVQVKARSTANPLVQPPIQQEGLRSGSTISGALQIIDEAI
jgi:hypothetical protein